MRNNFKQVFESFINPSTKRKTMLITKKTQGESKPLRGMPADRQEALDKLIITITSGKVFDGDDDSLLKLDRALRVVEESQKLGNPPITTTMWRLTNNIPTLVTVEEIREAFVLGSMQYSIEFLKH